MPILEVEKLKKSYATPEGVRHSIIDVERFTMEPGEQIALEGGSGSGKTTLLNLIAGILQADSGRVSIAGQEMQSLTESARDLLRANQVGYVFQTFNLLQGYTALENVELAMLFGKGVNGSAARRLLERVGLADRMTYRPRQLSVGQQQRVAVARALANGPALVLADEPTGNLDAHHAMRALELIRGICRENNAALLLVSHDAGVLAQFQKTVKLSELNRALQSGQELARAEAGA